MRIVLLVAIAAVLAPAALAAPPPHVRLAAAGVVGTGFHARERVTLTVRAGAEHWTKAVVTNAAGAFTARVAVTVASGGCQGVSVLAVGARGERAAWKAPPRPCGNPIAP
ncbi:MAG TPA: hypothetical protein VHC67_06825 [Gaiellaceae bacterium]|jgi:hypothetical protein|nr:hypothetical protein [Gaiellaceae bacterium]